MTKEKEIIKWLESLKKEIGKAENRTLWHYAKPIDMAIEALKAQEWTPCSERPPSDSDNYLITIADLRLGHIGEHAVTMADFYAKEKKWSSAVDVYAWRQLPEPYREDEELAIEQMEHDALYEPTYNPEDGSM